MKVRKAIIPAAGLGTRLLPNTKSIPKEMLPLVDKPVLQNGLVHQRQHLFGDALGVGQQPGAQACSGDNRFPDFHGSCSLPLIFSFSGISLFAAAFSSATSCR